ncbi:DapH/DapD/GlmU-related protein [Fibrella aquatica]|uniref:DapH/DapD/GlmU-related protein n=1 Tax=Fibrella aquatica TaxID=3242487 RepID=UPI00352140F0
MSSSHNKDTYNGPSFPLKNRIARVIWNISYVLLFKITPNPFHRWRSFLLRCFGATIGRNVHVYPGVKIWAPWNLDLGDECGIANGVELYSQGKVKVGKRAIISQGTYICTGTHDYTLQGHPLITFPIEIGDYAWVAAEAFVHPGVTIGEGCVVGARSVVTKDMPAWMVCAGHPCKPLKKREFQPEASIEAVAVD